MKLFSRAPHYINTFHGTERRDLQNALLLISVCCLKKLKWWSWCLGCQWIFRDSMYLLENIKNSLIPAIFFRNENMSKMLLLSFFSIIVYAYINSIFAFFFFAYTRLRFECRQLNEKTCFFNKWILNFNFLLLEFEFSLTENVYFV